MVFIRCAALCQEMYVNPESNISQGKNIRSANTYLPYSISE